MTLDLVKFYTVSRAVAHIEDDATRSAMQELIRAIEQMQKLQFSARKTEVDNLPANNQLAEQLNGVYIRIASESPTNLIHKVAHGLKRVPQGCIFTRHRTGNNQCIIEGDASSGVPAATDTHVTFSIGDPVGTVVVGLLF
jgi:hypothetical protein